MRYAILVIRKQTLTEWFDSWQSYPSRCPILPNDYRATAEKGENLTEWFDFAQLCGIFYPEYEV